VVKREWEVVQRTERRGKGDCKERGARYSSVDLKEIRRRAEKPQTISNERKGKRRWIGKK